MAKLLEFLSLWAGRLTGAVVVALTVVLVVSILVSIFFRYVVQQALSWPEEISMILFAWTVLLTGSLGVREGFHVRLTLFLGRLSTPIRKVMEALITLALLGFGAVLAYAGNDLVVRTATHLTPTLRLPLDLVNYAAPTCGVLICLHSLNRLVNPLKEAWQDE